MRLEDYLELHQQIEVHYVVTHYRVDFYDCDGDRLIVSAPGGTIEEAMTRLNSRLDLLAYNPRNWFADKDWDGPAATAKFDKIDNIDVFHYPNGGSSDEY